tara:strand:+ start:476 stop:712 length:237 start_codon:yes stop_codon:yes gene_type:complete
MYINYLIIVILIFLFFVGFSRILGIFRFRKLTMLDWMGMSTKDRYLSDNYAREKIMKRKKRLIRKVRKEYIKISKQSS